LVKNGITSFMGLNLGFPPKQTIGVHALPLKETTVNIPVKETTANLMNRPDNEGTLSERESGSSSPSSSASSVDSNESYRGYLWDNFYPRMVPRSIVEAYNNPLHFTDKDGISAAIVAIGITLDRIMTNMYGPMPLTQEFMDGFDSLRSPWLQWMTFNTISDMPPQFIDIAIIRLNTGIEAKTEMLSDPNAIFDTPRTDIQTRITLDSRFRDDLIRYRANIPAASVPLPSSPILTAVSNSKSNSPILTAVSDLNNSDNN
jgi:hypothetical protein